MVTPPPTTTTAATALAAYHGLRRRPGFGSSFDIWEFLSIGAPVGPER